MKRILLLLLMLVSTPFFGQTYQTWRTEATDNIWQTNNNWWNFPNGSPIVFGQQEWDNNHQLTQQSNADVSTWRFLFKAGASTTHTFNGNKIRFFDFGGQNPSIINDSSVNQIINNNIEGDGDAADPLEIRVNNGNLTFNGTINNMGSWIDIYGVNGKSVSFTGAISGSAGLTVKENSTVTLSNANNTYSGSTSVDAGTLIVQKGGHSASITTGAIAFTFASSNQAAGVYDFLPGQLGGNTSRTLTSNLVGGKTISFNYTTGDVTICDVMTVTTASIASNNANSSSLAKSGDVITLSFTTSESASVTPSVSINGNAATVTGSGTSWSATKTVVGGDVNGIVTFSISFQNAFGCSGTRNTVTNGSSVTIDTTAPTVPSAAIASNNANSSSYAKTGDTITLSFTTSETPAVTPSVSINGNAATVSGGGTTWSATKTVVGGDTNGNVTFSIGISDAAGNTATRTSTTNSSSVTIDNSAPSFVAVSIASNNAGNSSIAVPGDNVTLTFSTSESVTTPSVILNGTSATVSGSGTSWSATTAVLTCSGSVVSFSISISDITGNTANSTSTTNSSQVTISAQVGTPSFTAGATLVCQDAANETYTATAANATGGIFYSVDPEEAGVINDVTGVMNWDAAFSGVATITAYAFGCNGPTTSDRIVTVQSKYLFYVDGDGDGYGSTTSSMLCSTSALVAPTGFSTNDDDCNDANASIHPGATEICFNNIDDNCDGNKSEGCAPIIINVLPGYCGNTLALVHSTITATVPVNTTGYSLGYLFRITNLSTNQTRYLPRSIRNFNLLMTDIADYNTTYSVAVAAIINGEEQTVFGSECLITTPPIPTTRLVKCVEGGTTLAVMSSSISCLSVNLATAYKFKVALASNPTVFTEIVRTSQGFQMTMLDSSFPLLFDTEYLVQVKVRISAANAPIEVYGDYGDTCVVKTPLAPDISIVGCVDPSIAPASMTTNIFANSVSGATMYRFTLVNTELGYEQVIEKPVRYFNLAEFNSLSPLVAGEVYSIFVDAKIYGSYNLGKDCNITVPGASKVGMETIGFEATAYPNPYTNNFMIDVKTSSQSMVTVKVFDMVGRLVEERKANVSDIENTTIGDRYPSGVYNVVITQDEEVKTLRVVKR